MAPQPSILTRALAYAEAGISVFPCVPGEKRPLTARGYLDASTDSDRIRFWWAASPRANIASPTGTPGFDALDVDVHPDGNGWDAVRRLDDAGLLVGWTRAVRTPSGGLHLHYQGSEQRSGSLRGQHVDFRGLGGYVLLPPSQVQTADGLRGYGLIATRPGPGRTLDWLAITRLLTPAGAGQSPSSPRTAVPSRDPVPPLAAHVARQVEGNRNNALFWAACRAAESGATDLQPLVDAATGTGLPERQARRTVRSAQDTIARGSRPLSPAAPSELLPPIRSAS